MSKKLQQILVALILCSTWFWVGADTLLGSIWPSLVTLSTVLLSRSVITGLLVGATSGTLLLSNGNPLSAFISFFSDHLIPALQNKWNISVLIFTLLMGGFVAIIEHGGGLLEILTRFLGKKVAIRSRTLWATFLLGIICFFDGLANSMLVGRVMRPVADKVGISREKLSYVVDSTSSPIACIAFISTWIAYQLSMIQEGLNQLGIKDNPYVLFLYSIPYNFYCLFTLALVMLVIYKDINIGYMAEAEKGLRTDEFSVEEDPETTQKTGHWCRAIIPLTVFILALILGLYLSGARDPFPITLSSFATAVGDADTALVLVCSSAFASIVALAFNFETSPTTTSSGKIFLKGMSNLFVPVLILVSAWCLSSTLKDLETSKMLSQILSGNLSPMLLPAAVFLVGTLISFTTGTSWGTMGVLMPLALPISISLTVNLEHDHARIITVLTIAAVFSGAVFGDHCSPMSDTTIVSSIACGIEPIDHVRSQFPYAILAAAFALFLGFLPSSFGVSYWVLIITALIGFFLIYKWTLNSKLCKSVSS